MPADWGKETTMQMRGWKGCFLGGGKGGSRHLYHGGGKGTAAEAPSRLENPTWATQICASYGAGTDPKRCIEATTQNKGTNVPTNGH